MSKNTAKIARAPSTLRLWLVPGRTGLDVAVIDERGHGCGFACSRALGEFLSAFRLCLFDF